ncbi:MAG TPA: ABC transporter substrate-binding protein, partial [Terriglobia bacterium]|nr:ABC transporter substrate-binding protein [Terriglobia bacterium]
MRSAFRSLAAASAALLAAALVHGATRPRYGGTLRIEISASVTTLDPAAEVSGSAEAEARARFDAMLFDRLTTLDSAGNAIARLATSWSHDPDSRKWQFSIREGVRLEDGTLLSAQDAAQSLTAANRDWRVNASDNTLVIEMNSPHPDLPAELALARNSILHRGTDGALAGTGPFRLSEWNSGHHATLTANDEYWDGRPYVDTVEVAMGRAYRDQLIDLELGRADVVQLAIDELRRAAQENLRTVASSPVELMAILFSPGKPSTDDARLRQALALSIDRTAIRDVLLQKQGEPAGGLLPGWLSGYEFLFPAQQDPAAAKKLRAQLPASASLTLGYDADDSLARAVVERVALNARDIGLTVRPASYNSDSAKNVDARVVIEPPITANFREALAGTAEWLHEPVAQLRAKSATTSEAYEIERALLADARVIPLFHLPVFV